MDKDNELEHIQMKWENQEFELCQHQQQKEKLQQQHDDIKKTHKLEITKINKVLSSNTEELSWLRNPNKTLITNIKKLKHSRKKEQSNEDLEGRVLENQEKNQRLKNLNQELKKQIKKLKEDKKLQDERFEKIHSKNNLLENKIAQIQKEASRIRKTKSSRGSEGSPHHN